MFDLKYRAQMCECGRWTVVMAACALLLLAGTCVTGQAQQIEPTDDGWVYHWDPETPLEGGDPLPTEPTDPQRFGGVTEFDGGVSTTTPEPTSLLLAAAGGSAIWMCGLRHRRT